MGIVVEKEEAKESVCTCYQLDGELLCFSSGVVGALSNGQETTLCADKITRSPSPEYQEHIRDFKEWADVADVCLEEEVDTWPCVEEEAKKRQ